MATCVSTLTVSPTTTTTNNPAFTLNTNLPPLPCFQRRSSIRRGTISSLSKDVRVNDFVEIIKQQKVLQQKEREADPVTSTLRRRHSMMNMSNKTPPKRQQTLPSRMRTMSNSDLKSTHHNDLVIDKSSDQSRLDRELKGNTNTLAAEMNQQLRKCIACHESKKETSLPPQTSSLTSASTLSNDQSSCSSQTSRSSNPVSQQQDQVMKELDTCMSRYSGQMDLLLKHPQSQDLLQTCKKLMEQQQALLAQLEELVTNASQVPLVPPPPPLPLPPSSSSTLSSSNSSKGPLLQNVLSAMRPKTNIVIRQTPDKNEANTIFSVKGICTTNSYFPDRSVQQYAYSLDLTHHDRLHKFVLKPTDQWQADNKADECQDAQCHQGFNWFQRKHHCRGCGNIYCSTHSSNRLPLFTGEALADKPVFSRVCDACFFQLTSHSLKPVSM